MDRIPEDNSDKKINSYDLENDKIFLIKEDLENYLEDLPQLSFIIDLDESFIYANKS